MPDTRHAGSGSFPAMTADPHAALAEELAFLSWLTHQPEIVEARNAEEAADAAP